MTTHDDDLLGTKSLRRDDAAQAHGAITHHGDRAATANPGRDRRMVAGAHHIRKREQRRHQRIVLADVQGVEGAVSLWHAQRLGLCTAGLAAVAEEAAVDARGLQSVVAEHAAAVGVGEGHHDDLAAPEPFHVTADLLDDADGFMAHLLAGHVRTAVVGPQIASADAGAGDANDGVSWVLDRRRRGRSRSGRRRPYT